MLVSKSITDIHNGVSQQSPALRLESQSTEITNGMITLLDGVYKRPPTKYVKTLNSAAETGAALVHTIERDSTERYVVIFAGNDTEPIEIFDLDGNKKTVKYGYLGDDLYFKEDNTIKNYLDTSGAPKYKLRATTVADYTIVCNTEKKVAMMGAQDTKLNAAMLYIKTLQPNSYYTVYINGTQYANVLIPPTQDNLPVPTSFIASQLAGALNAHSELTVSSRSNVVVFWFNDNRDFSFYSQDGNGNQAMLGFKDKCTSYERLPANSIGEDLIQLNASPYNWVRYGTTREFKVQKSGGPANLAYSPVALRIGMDYYVAQGTHGSLQPGQWDYVPAEDTIYVRLDDDSDPTYLQDPIYYVGAPRVDYRIQISQGDKGQQTAYYVRFSDGNWIETRCPGLKNRFNPTTMPHRLVRMADGSFVFAPIRWAPRKVGDEQSCPTPSFSGRRIQNVFFFKNRLGLLCDDNVVLSKAGDYFCFWPTTAMEVLDDDPIDVSVSNDQVVTLREAIPFNKQLLLRADTSQFVMGNTDTLTPKTVCVDPTTRFDTISFSQSCNVGSNVYLCCPNSNYMTIREYFVQPDSMIDDAADITINVPSYIPKGNMILKALSSYDVIFGWMPESPKDIWVYKYFWTGNQKAQSAWFKWTFAHDILGIATFDTILFMVMRKPDPLNPAAWVVTLEKLDIRPTVNVLPGSSVPFEPYLDGMLYFATGTVSVNPVGATITTWELPWGDEATDYQVIRCDTGLPWKSVQKVSPTMFVIDGDKSGIPVWIGKPYTMTWELSPWFLRDNQGNVQQGGRLQHRNVTFGFADTGFFEVTVIPTGKREPMVKKYTGKAIGSRIISRASIESGTHRFPVMGQAQGQVRIIVSNATHFPCKFQSITHEGYFTARAKSI